MSIMPNCTSNVNIRHRKNLDATSDSGYNRSAFVPGSGTHAMLVDPFSFPIVTHRPLSVIRNR